MTHPIILPVLGNLLSFKNSSDETITPVAMLILGDDGKFYQAAHFIGFEGLTLPKWSIDENLAIKLMKQEAKKINKELKQKKK